ncbi:MAG: carbon-nitrogen hydrolase family protein [Xanthomonadales bacterium]|nr:carbon-nitrogen hydrolase family protein [Xanthomonadales bacterium]ODU93795.1 MAG: hydrolase [Rhodanobacter sp. SCN 66-43]OJY83242.1 MAG: carbon-nitrogen hydrolase family protein [Xanthomonadales bacterium 66-474]
MASRARTSKPEPAARGFGIAALQLDLDRGDNVARIAAEVAMLKKRMPWVRMVVVGELAAFGADPARAQAMPGPAEQRFCEVARKHGLWLVPGSIYERKGSLVFNTAPVIDPAGNVVARYRKQFPFYPYEKGVEPGHESIVFDVPGVGRFGISICYDMWFAETTRSLCWMGAEVILHPTMTYTIDRDVELAIARASAASNQCYFVDVNVAGSLGLGRSIVCGPGGEVIHQAGSGREIIAFEVDFAYLRNVRERGWQCLTQPLKSFRDSKIVFPAYGAGVAPSETLARLGRLAIATDGGDDPGKA